MFSNSRVAPLVGNDASHFLCLAFRGLPLALEMRFHRFCCSHLVTVALLCLAIPESRLPVKIQGTDKSTKLILAIFPVNGVKHKVGCVSKEIYLSRISKEILKKNIFKMRPTLCLTPFVCKFIGKIAKKKSIKLINFMLLCFPSVFTGQVLAWHFVSP